MNPHIISSALGIIFIAFGAIILLPITIAGIDEDLNSALPFLVASACSLSLGLLCRRHGRHTRNFDNLKRTEGLLIVSLTWIVAAAIGAIPFFILQPFSAGCLF